MKERKISLARLAARSDAVAAESTLRSYINKTRDISLKDFFRLCDHAGVNPHDVLFGPLALTVDEAKKLSESVAQTLSDIRPIAATKPPNRPPLLSRVPKRQKVEQ